MIKTFFYICIIILIFISFLCSLYFVKKLDDSYDFDSYLKEFSLLDLICLICGFPFILLFALFSILIYILVFLDSIKFF